MARRYKKVDGGHGHHGGAWKVAYADFVTAMMALFMVLWLLASSDATTRKEISNYFRSGILPEGDMSMNRASQVNPSVIEQSPNPPPQGEESLQDSNDKAAKQISDKLHKMAALDSGLARVVQNVKVEVTADGIVIEAVDEDNGLLFDSASAKLSEPLERFLRALGPIIASLEKPIEINGHTDARPFATGSKVSNWDLSYQRAESARVIFVDSGVPEEKIRGVFARGASQLYKPEDPLAAQNRRLSILIRTAKPGGVKVKPDIFGGSKPADP